MADNAPLELVTTSEAARRLSVVKDTLARKIAKAGLQPDGFLLEGSTGRRSELFVVTRLPRLQKLIESEMT